MQLHWLILFDENLNTYSVLQNQMVLFFYFSQLFHVNAQTHLGAKNDVCRITNTQIQCTSSTFDLRKLVSEWYFNLRCVLKAEWCLFNRWNRFLRLCRHSYQSVALLSTSKRTAHCSSQAGYGNSLITTSYCINHGIVLLCKFFTKRLALEKVLKTEIKVNIWLLFIVIQTFTRNATNRDWT